MSGEVDELDPDADLWLVAKARAGDVNAYEVLIRRHRDRIYRIALRMLGNPHDAEDVAQDVAIQLWTALSGFVGSSSFTTWLYRIVVNRCLNHLRRHRPTRPVLDTDPTPAPGAEDIVIAKQRAAATLRAIAALPPDRGWLGRELARWQWLTGRSRGLCSAGFPAGCATPVAMVSVLRFQLPPVDPCMRFSRTRLTDVLHRRCSA